MLFIGKYFNREVYRVSMCFFVFIFFCYLVYGRDGWSFKCEYEVEGKGILEFLISF